jgi:hypothetical protein
MASMALKHPTMPPRKTFTTNTRAGKVTATVVWDVQGIIIVDFTPRGATVVADAYQATL